jgi:hypothetical protein
MTANGSASWSTAQAPTGLTSSMYFDGSRDWISTPDAVEFDLGASSWTIESRMQYIARSQYGTMVCQIGSYPSGSPGWWIIGPSAGDQNIYFEWTTNGSTWLYLAFPWAPTNGVWYDVALVKNGTALTAYVNGSQIGSTQTCAGTFFNSVSTVDIGGVSGQGAASYDFYGYIASLRITAGIARYTSNYTPPSLPLPR